MSGSSDFQCWDIWIARVAFEDQPETSKIRPVLIVDDKGQFVLSIKITSHIPRKSVLGEYQIEEWKNAGLLKPSTIRLTKRLHLPKSSFIKKIGRLSRKDQNNLLKLIS